MSLFKKDSVNQNIPLRKSKPRDPIDKCSVSDCNETAIRSLSIKKVKSIISNVNSEGKRAHLCKAHYKDFKKKTKPERDAERWGW